MVSLGFESAILVLRRIQLVTGQILSQFWFGYEADCAMRSCMFIQAVYAEATANFELLLKFRVH